MTKGKRMTKKTKTTKDIVADKVPATDVEVNVPTAEKATKDKELVMKATLPKEAYSSTTTVVNRSQNKICLIGGPQLQITFDPREIKTVSKDELKELLKNPMIRRFFDKGILTHNLHEADDVVSAHDAVAPESLTQAVERHEGGSNVVAEVKKFEREGSLNIDLQ